MPRPAPRGPISRHRITSLPHRVSTRPGPARPHALKSVVQHFVLILLPQMNGLSFPFLFGLGLGWGVCLHSTLRVARSCRSSVRPVFEPGHVTNGVRSSPVRGELSSVLCAQCCDAVKYRHFAGSLLRAPRFALFLRRSRPQINSKIPYARDYRPPLKYGTGTKAN